MRSVEQQRAVARLLELPFQELDGKGYVDFAALQEFIRGYVEGIDEKVSSLSERAAVMLPLNSLVRLLERGQP